MTATVPYGSLLKAPKVKRAKGRARPEEPLRHWCEVSADVCTGRAECRHHRLRRGQGGTDDQANTTDACDACHEHIHRNPEWSYAAGWLLHA